jgi:hypothetical protein
MASVMAVNTPYFTGAFVIGDVTYRIMNAIVTSMECTSYNSPICVSSHDSPYDTYIPNSFQQTEIMVRMRGAGIIMESGNTKQKVSHKLVKDCTVEELLFAIQTKIKKV